MLVCSLTRKLTENTSHWNRTQSSHLNSDTNLHETALDQFLLYRTWSSSTLYFPPYFKSISYKPDPHPTAAVSVGPLFRVRSEQDLLESSPTFPYLVRPRVNHRSNLGFYWLSSPTWNIYISSSILTLLNDSSRNEKYALSFHFFLNSDKISLEFKLSSLSQKGSPRHVKEPALPDLGRLRWAGLTANLLPLGSFPTALLFPISTPVAWFFSM